MPYTINKYSGPQITVVADGTIDSTLDIKLIGKNYAGYGEVQNENLVFMLENFSSPTPPANKMTGQIWFDSGTSKLKFFDSQKWRTTGGAEIGSTAPTGLTTGDFWYDTANQQLNAWDASAGEFVLIGPQGVAGAGTTQLKSRSVKDDVNASHIIIEAIVDEKTLYIISNDTFTLGPAPADQIVGFTKVYQGVTLPYTGDNGITAAPNDHRFWGTATNADKLNGLSADNFVTASGPGAKFDSEVNFSDAGFTIGANPRLRIENVGSSTPTISNLLSDTIVFKTYVGGTGGSGGVTTTPLKFVGANSLPGSNNASNLGSSSLKFNTVYATSFNGLATQASTLLVAGVPQPATVDSVGLGTFNSIAARDGQGNLNAVAFQGTSTSAFYADLAEKYLADQEYEVGTVLCVGGEKEVTACSWGKRAIGTVSENPAFKMNSELEGGTYVALKGRVPVKVIGRIKKGEELIAADNGCAMMAVPHASRVFAVALETSDDEGVKLVECLVL
jgi:hypothetical protein